MGKILDFTINMSMLFGGDFAAKVQPAMQTLAVLQERTRTLQRVSGQITSYQKQNASLSQLGEKVAKAREKYERLGEQLQTTTKVNARVREDYRQALQDYRRLESSYQRQKKEVDALQGSLTNAGISAEKFGSRQRELERDLERNRNAMKRLNDAQARYIRARSQLDWGSMKGDILQSTAVVKAFQKPITIDMEFEQAMANVRAVAAPTEEQFTALRTQALEMGSATQFTSTQSAQAQEVLMRAGLKAEEVLQVLPNILQTAGAEGMEISQAADILINVTKNMNLPISELGRVADVMGYTSSHANTNIAQLGEAALKAAGPFSSMGGTIEELMSTLGAMSNTVRGAEAGTALAGVTRRLGKDPKAVAQELSRYGIKTMDRQGNFAPFAEIIAQVEQRANRLGTKKAAGLRANIYGMFGSQMQGFGRTLQNGEYKTLLTGTQTESAGASAQMNRTRNDTLKGDITSLGSAWEGLMIRIGSALDPINRFVTGTLTTGIQKLNTWIDQHKDWVDLIIQAGYTLGGLLVLQKVWKYARLAYEAFAAWKELKAATAVIEGATGALGGMGSMLGGLGTIISAHPIVTIGTLVATAVTLAIANWEKLKAWWEGWTPAPKTALEIEQNKEAVAATQAKYGTLDLRPSYMKTQATPVRAHATGGILTRPHLGLVAEEGPEAVIPLTDRSRGLPLLERAADFLGVRNFGEQSPTINNTSRTSTSNYTPTINITVNGTGETSTGLADKIAEAVRDELRNIMSLEERISYA